MPKKDKILEWVEEYLLLLPLVIAVGIIPLIVRIQYYDPGLSSYSWFPNENNVMDMFMYWKNKAMMQLDVLLLVGYLYLALKRQLPKAKIFIPLGIYVMLVGASSFLSVVPHTTWSGFYGLLESAYSIFGYALVCYYAYAVVKTEKQLKIVMGALFVGVVVLGTIGVSQFVGNDFYMSDFGKDLIFPSLYEGYKDYLKPSMGVGRVYASLYNPNYVGFYGCLLVPFFMLLSFTAKERKQSVLPFLLGSIVLICVVGARNKTAVLLFVPMMLFMVVYFGKNYWKQILSTFVAAIVVFVLSNLGQDIPLVDSVTDVVIQDNEIDEGASDLGTLYHLELIHLNDEDFTVVYNEESLSVKYIKNADNFWEIEVKDSSGNIIPEFINEEETGFYLDDEKYSGLEFIFGADEDINVGFSVVVGNESYFIYYSEKDATYYHTNEFGRRAKIFASETFDCPLFNLMDGFHGRGFIWSKSVPILKETLIIGSGPGTYAFMFPQYDYVAIKQNEYGGMLITKPHNMYLQMGIETGILSLIAFLVFYMIYFVQSAKLYWQRRVDGFVPRCGAAIWVGSICYMMSGMLNDSTIGVSIIFWSLLGLGYACNRIVQSAESVDVII